MFFSIITKNSNWEVLTKNLVTFKRWDRIKYEKLWYFGRSLKSLTLKGVGQLTKTQYRGGDFLKKGAWQEREGCCFWEGVDTPMHTMYQLRWVTK